MSKSTGELTEAQATEFRSAGELFGLLKFALNFGELQMRTLNWGESAPTQAIVFEWSFMAKGRRYFSSYIVSLDELSMTLEPLPDAAREIAQQWKEHHRGAGREVTPVAPATELTRRLKWIFVDDSLPPFGEVVLLSVKRSWSESRKQVCALGKRKKDRRVKPSGYRWETPPGQSLFGAEVVAWMRLPDHPT